MTTGTASVKWLDLTGQEFVALTMAPVAHRRESVERLYPEYSWVDEEGPLWNWIHAVADDQRIEHEDAAEAIRNLSDPIFGGPNSQKIAMFVWYLA